MHKLGFGLGSVRDKRQKQEGSCRNGQSGQSKNKQGERAGLTQLGSVLSHFFLFSDPINLFFLLAGNSTIFFKFPNSYKIYKIFIKF